MGRKLGRKVSRGDIEMTEKPTSAPQGAPAAPRRGYRIAEAAEYMGVSPWFVEVKIRSEELPALKLCRHYTILKEDMDAFLDSAKKRKGRSSDRSRGRRG